MYDRWGREANSYGPQEPPFLQGVMADSGCRPSRREITNSWRPHGPWRRTAPRLNRPAARSGTERHPAKRRSVIAADPPHDSSAIKARCPPGRVYVGNSRNAVHHFCSSTCHSRAKAAAFRARTYSSACAAAERAAATA
ncbi:CGNR zinc finger domain-containing protein [Streptomyces longisporoflavus]|uniref:CGNR zinc finger domain-containing protein n=1 Tax=Streptomyces longisporoflavus TaxID=28044 RepID=A0ABW7QI73_9ACTN